MGQTYSKPILLHNDITWYNVQTFDDIKFMMHLYLNGYIQETPWYAGQLDSETYLIINSLMRINKRNYLTIDSQPGTCLYNKPILNTTLRYNEEQRGYISGYICKNIITCFTKLLLLSKKVAIIKYNKKLKKNIVEFPHIKIPPDFWDYDNYQSYRISLTRDKIVTDNKWRYYTGLCVGINDNDEPYTTDILMINNILEKYCEYITVIMIERGNTNLSYIVESALDKCK